MITQECEAHLAFVVMCFKVAMLLMIVLFGLEIFKIGRGK
jgi:hypothetical protein